MPLPQRGDADREWRVLTSEAGRSLLDQVARVPKAGPADVARWRKAFEAGDVLAAQRLVEGRRKGASKFERADTMWLDPVGAEQSTAEPVARHKARRFEGGGPVVDLCCGVGGDAVALALAGARPVLAVDLDQGMCRRTQWNAAVHELADRVLAVRCRAERFPIPDAARVHVDPDRRASGGSKANRVDAYAPAPPFLLHLARSARGGAIKLGPASDFATWFGGEGFEVELVSLSGECKEATTWFGDLATPGVRRRATVLPAGATWTDRDGPSSPRMVVGPLDRFVHEPDPSLIRAGLLDGFAEVHGLRRVAAGVDLLTGPGACESPFLTAFAVVEVFPLDLKVLRREVAARAQGVLEIKTRGLDVRPEAYRRALRPEGTDPATWIFVGRKDGPGLAILARRPGG